MKNSIIYKFFFLGSFFMICASYAQGPMSCVARKINRARTTIPKIIPESVNGTVTYRFLIKHYIYRRPDGSQPMQQRDINTVMAGLNENFISSNIQFSVCGNAEILTVGQNRSGVVEYGMGDGDYGNIDSLEAERSTPHTINIYWPFDLVNKYVPFDPEGIFNKKVDGLTNFTGNDIPTSITMNHFKSNSIVLDIQNLTHEMGHYFGLEHTFGYNGLNGPDDDGKGTYEHVARTGDDANCDYEGDGFCDTPADPNRYVGNCRIGVWKDEKGVQFEPDETNFMCYSTCKSTFSNSQKTKMKSEAAIMGYDLNQFELHLSNSLNNINKTYSSPNITADNTISGSSNVTYKGIGQVLLSPSFKAIKGVTFRAYVDIDCNNLDLPASANITNTSTDVKTPSKKDLKNLQVFPNPSHSLITVACSLKEDSKTQVYIQNLFGQEVMNLEESKQSKGDYKKQFDVSELPAGIYFLVLKSDSDTHIQKLVKLD